MANPVVSTHPPTKQDWMNDTYQFSSKSKIQEINSDAEKPYVILEATIFHPQGGGQPSDIGKITAKNLPDLNVTFVKLDKATNLVFHEINNSDEDIQKWKSCENKEVDLLVDEKTRRLHAKLHSGGHLLDNAVAGLSELNAIKCYANAILRR